jgi:hypothetical protein
MPLIDAYFAKEFLPQDVDRLLGENLAKALAATKQIENTYELDI